MFLKLNCSYLFMRAPNDSPMGFAPTIPLLCCSGLEEAHGKAGGHESVCFPAATPDPIARFAMPEVRSSSFGIKLQALPKERKH